MPQSTRAQLAAANNKLNAALLRRPWVAWAFVCGFVLAVFFGYRVAKVGSIAKTFATDPVDDTSGARAGGVLLGVLEDLVAVSYLALVLWAVDASLNHFSCCNDTPPDGCLDCFSHGLYSGSRLKLVFKRFLRFVVSFAVFGAMVAATAVDAVLVQTRHVRFSFNWLGNYIEGKDIPALVVAADEERRRFCGALAVALALAFVIALVTTIWVNLTLWNPIGHLVTTSHCCRKRHHNADLAPPPSVNYIVIEEGEFFDSDDNQVQGTLSLIQHVTIPDPVMEDDDNEPRWQRVVVAILLSMVVFVLLPILLVAIARQVPPVAGQVALNVSVNAVIQGIIGRGLE